MTDTANAPERIWPKEEISEGVFVNVDPESVIAALEAELHLLKTAGIIEVAVRNPNVADYMEHWEGRAIKTETHCDELVAAAYLDARERCGPQKCKGCVHFQRTRDRWPSGDGETYDYGTENKCLAADRLIEETVYGSMNPSSPDWCPHPITPDNARAALTARDERMKAEGAEAADEEAFARGANWAQEKARVEGRLVIVDSPELATLRADLAEANAKIARLTEALAIAGPIALKDFDNHPFVLDAEERRKVETIRAALQENANE